MNLDFAVDRLYDVGWTPGADAELERLPDGRRMPTVSCVKREFDQAGLELLIRHTPEFQCYRATWKSTDDRASGTVVATSEREAAVYALAQLHASTRAAAPQSIGQA